MQMQPITRDFCDSFRALRELWNDILEKIEFSREQPEGGPRALDVLIRSAARVEQTFGGINSQLWDDPFEWTLPEVMTSRERVREYFEEVDSARRSAISRIQKDDELGREIWTPAGSKTLAALLLSTLQDASALAGAASLLADGNPPKT